MNKAVANLFQRLPSARKIWLNIHLWLGLTAGFVLALIGLTGSLLVFYGPLLQMELGYKVEGSPPAHDDIDGWIAAARRSYPDIGAIDFVIGPGAAIGGSKVANLAVPGRQVSDDHCQSEQWTASQQIPLHDTHTAEILKFHTRLTGDVTWALEAIA